MEERKSSGDEGRWPLLPTPVALGDESKRCAGDEAPEKAGGPEGEGEGRKVKPTLGARLYVVWLILLALGIYAFPAWGVFHVPVMSEGGIGNLIVFTAWPFVAYYVIRWQWRIMTDP